MRAKKRNNHPHSTAREDEAKDWFEPEQLPEGLTNTTTLENFAFQHLPQTAQDKYRSKFSAMMSRVDA